jgi:hypothetical protein
VAVLLPIAIWQTAKQLADDLRERVKALGYERYKLIIQVTVGQKTGQAMRIQSRCLWVSCIYSLTLMLRSIHDIWCLPLNL